MNHEYDLVEARQKDGEIAAREKGESCTVHGWTNAHRTHPRGPVHGQCGVSIEQHDAEVSDGNALTTHPY